MASASTQVLDIKDKRWYDPTPRSDHITAVVDDKLFMWGGKQDGAPRDHNSSKKIAHLSHVDVFNLKTGSWKQKATSGTPPLGAEGYACAVLGNNIYYFGGYCGHGQCYHNSVHKLSTSASMQWRMLAPTTTKKRMPMKKSHCGIVGLNIGEEELLFVLGGSSCIAPSSRQPEAEYEISDNGFTFTNEQYLFSLRTCQWSSPTVTGRFPPSCCNFTLTLVGRNRAAMYGGYNNDFFHILSIVELRRHSVHWIRINKPVRSSVQWPVGRGGHAAACVSGLVLFIIGGDGASEVLSDCWICDTTTGDWEKLSLPESAANKRRRYHSVSSLQVESQCVWLLVFGGELNDFTTLSNTTIIELLQGKGGHWSVGTVLEEPALTDRNVYQQRLAKRRRKGPHNERQLLQEIQKLPEDIDRRQSLQQSDESAIQIMPEYQELQQQVKQLEEEKQQLLLRSEEQATQVLQLQHQLEAMTVWSSEEPHWVVRREEVVLTSEVLGRGGWGEVRVAHFRGLRVAAKTLHQLIISQYNLCQFMREMDISAKLRHPNLLLFIGATRDGEQLILTELMPTSLRKELEKGELSREDIIIISSDVVCGVSYLHQWKPHPIIHRDISSGNVLLEPLRNCWRAKVSDYGSANCMNKIVSTINPGCPVYAAPEGNNPKKHSPKMDVFSFGVLLVEMCLAEFPESRPEQIKRIQWPAMVSLIRRCISEGPDKRPTMKDISQLLSRF